MVSGTSVERLGTGCGLHSRGNFLYLVVEVAVSSQVFGDLSFGVHHSGVIAVAKMLANDGVRLAGDDAADVDGNLAGVNE